MEQKAANPLNSLHGRPASPLIEAYFELCHLKQLYRQGWLRRGVPRERCESVSEHSFGVAILAMWLAPAAQPAVDMCKAVQIALLHDIGEIYAGDIIPADGVDPAQKNRLESEAINQVLAKLAGGQVMIDLWREYEAGETVEARFVRQIDRLEMSLQAAVYRSQGLPGMDEFFETARVALSDPALIGIFNELISQE